MRLILFYSWQSDTPDEIGHNFIVRALEIAARHLEVELQIDTPTRWEGVSVDHDTKGVPGTPPIVETIFKKIDSAAIFIPDLTFVGKRRDESPLPNPNVLIEYGWALKSLGHGRILPVMNLAYGEPTPATMPFDLRHLRFPEITYNLPEGANQDRLEEECNLLATKFAEAIRGILASDDFKRSISDSLETLPFPRAVPQNGRARFRPTGSALGTSDRREIRLAEGPAIWLRVTPSRPLSAPRYAPEIKQLVTQSPLLMPLVQDHFINRDSGYLIAEDGFGIFGPYDANDPSCSSIIFVFETGEVWSIDTSLLSEPRSIPYFERYFVTALIDYTSFLRDRLSVPPPYCWIAGIEGVKGRPIELPLQQQPRIMGNQPFLTTGSRGSCLADVIEEEGSYSGDTSATDCLRPFFTKVYARCGIHREPWMDQYLPR